MYIYGRVPCRPGPRTWSGGEPSSHKRVLGGAVVNPAGLFHLRVAITMSYTVLARKYRSQTFDDVVGQDPAARTLKNAIRSGRVAHAYLFCGPRGTVKTSTARALAMALNCERGPTPEPCG